VRDTGDECCAGAERNDDRAENSARWLAHPISPFCRFSGDSGGGD
jgi:hypothetical protein